MWKSRCVQLSSCLKKRNLRAPGLGNKAIYRTRKAIADGGELYVLAPGVERFGEDAEIDTLIRKYGYTGRENILRKIQEAPERGRIFPQQRT